MLAILKALQILVHTFHDCMIVESDSRNAIACVSSFAVFPWRVKFHFCEIDWLSLIASRAKARRAVANC